jgi:hypothetical protein
LQFGFCRVGGLARVIAWHFQTPWRRGYGTFLCNEHSDEGIELSDVMLTSEIPLVEGSFLTIRETDFVTAQARFLSNRRRNVVVKCNLRVNEIPRYLGNMKMFQRLPHGEVFKVSLKSPCGPLRDLPGGAFIGDLKDQFVRGATLIVQHNRATTILCFDSPNAPPLDLSLGRWGRQTIAKLRTERFRHSRLPTFQFDACTIGQVRLAEDMRIGDIASRVVVFHEAEEERGVRVQVALTSAPGDSVLVDLRNELEVADVVRAVREQTGKEFDGDAGVFLGNQQEPLRADLRIGDLQLRPGGTLVLKRIGPGAPLRFAAAPKQEGRPGRGRGRGSGGGGARPSRDRDWARDRERDSDDAQQRPPGRAAANGPPPPVRIVSSEPARNAQEVPPPRDNDVPVRARVEAPEHPVRPDEVVPQPRMETIECDDDSQVEARARFLEQCKCPSVEGFIRWQRDGKTVTFFTEPAKPIQLPTPFDKHLILCGVAKALERVHSQNVFFGGLVLAKDVFLNDRNEPLLVRFSRATEFGRELPQPEGDMLSYLPDECMVRDTFPAHPAIDIWSFGVFLYELVTGREITAQESEKACWNRLDAPVPYAQLAKLLWQVRPEDRPQASEVVAELTRDNIMSEELRNYLARFDAGVEFEIAIDSLENEIQTIRMSAEAAVSDLCRQFGRNSVFLGEELLDEDRRLEAFGGKILLLKNEDRLTVFSDIKPIPDQLQNGTITLGISASTRRHCIIKRIVVTSPEELRDYRLLGPLECPSIIQYFGISMSEETVLLYRPLYKKAIRPPR